ncbi:A/G-specific adenine glycosylase [Ilumatobacter sp.]|uniref:A/G-specific adenine glycosylase n=1 Tax=Ilumatobacter sp. TaxID=1967498 RepID=UPI003B516A22
MIDPDAVLAWGAPRMRDLPWRGDRDPWRILVSEVMLQQTRAERVVERWHGFVRAFPSPADCAAVPLGDVLRLWQGLGYPRRARDLHTTAGIVGAEHGGSLPDDLGALLALPGIGPYTARAVLAFAFERDVGVVDTNIARILARTSGERLTPKHAQAQADALVPPGRGWIWNQVVMDLGALLCRPRPRCGDCPLATRCAWNVAGHPDPDPASGSAGVSTTQARFAGSDRQRRGEVMRALADRPRDADEFDGRIVDGLVRDGLVTADGRMIRLP